MHLGKPEAIARDIQGHGVDVSSSSCIGFCFVQHEGFFL